MANTKPDANQVLIDMRKNYAVGTIGLSVVNYQIDITQFPWLAKGDAKYQNPINGQWFKDAAYSQPATDDFPAIQAAFNWAAGKDGVRVWIPAGFFLLETGSPEVPSNVQVDGVGRDSSLLIQPNYYRYDRPTVPYDRAAVVDWNALWMDITTSNVSIQNIGMLGPFYRQDGDYSTHPVENWPASNGVHHRGNDYEFRKSLPYSSVGGFNIKVTDCYLEGWAEEAVQLDLVENFQVYRNKIRRCGRGGLRTYGGLHGWADFNDIQHIFPGDYLNSRTINGETIGGNRAYGVEFTRVYQSGCRPSEDIWSSFNRIRDCIQWKCMGTHGGRRIRFLFNDLEDGHHGIGVDKGGFTEAQGISPPSDIEIIGNRIVRIAPPDPNEGDREGGPGQAIFCTAHDQTDTHVGRGLIVHSNYAKGWGCDNLTGGAWLGNWIDVQWGSNTWEKCVGTAVRLRDRVDELVMAPQIVRDMVPSGAGQLRGIGVESANVRGMLQGGTFSNSNTTSLTAFYLSNPGTDMGVTIQPGSRLIGNVSLCNLPNNEQGGGGVGTIPKAVGNVLVSGGGTATLRVGRGVSSVIYESVGSYLITLKDSASNMNNMVVNVNCIGTNRTAYWTAVSVNSFRVNVVGTGTSTPTDNSFTFSAYPL